MNKPLHQITVPKLPSVRSTTAQNWTGRKNRGNAFVRCLLALLVCAVGSAVMTEPSVANEPANPAPVKTGAQILVETNFKALAGKRVGLITNQTGLVNGEHLVDLMHKSNNVDLVAILGPEHGFRGTVEAGDKVEGGTDPKTGIPVFSLYGKTRKPTKAMLRNVDILVFDVQDIGARFYTYISTMGLAMRAAADAHIPFVVLDRPNPLGGNYVSGFMLERAHKSFVGQYPIPIVHGMSVAELASMIKGEKWLSGLDNLDLRVMLVEGWRRSMRWPATKLKWVSTSPNIPTFTSALVYPGIGIVGDMAIVNEGRGTSEPFTTFGAPWLDAKAMVAKLNALKLPGVKFQAIRYKPISIPNVALNPMFKGRTINGVHLTITDVDTVEPLEIGMHVLPMIVRQARAKGIRKLFGDLPMFYLISGTRRLHKMLINGKAGHAIIGSWRKEVAVFKKKRNEYLLY